MLNRFTEADQFLNMLSSNKDLAYDCETNGLRWQQTQICGHSISDGKDAFYVPVRHDGDANINNVPEFEKRMATLIDERNERKNKLIGHNIKFDMHQCQNHGIYLGRNVGDTMVYAALLDENKYSYSLENVCKGYPDIEQKKGSIIKEYISKKFDVTQKEAMGHFWRLSGDDEMGCDYARTDTKSTYQLYEKQSRDLYAQQLDMVVSLENELTYVLQKMERQGVLVDIDRSLALKEEVEKLRLEAYQNIPLTEDLEIINVKSNKDLQKYFEFLGMDEWPVTEKGNPSFTTGFLKGFEEGENIIHARKLDHFKSSFLDPLANHIHNSRIYTNFNQTTGEMGGTKTGRLSSFGPNMQQIPKRDKFIGPKYRKIFIPDPGFKIIEFDYSQMEPRLFAHYSDEPILVEGYNKTPFVDMHDIASQYMNIPRDEAKHLNLGIMYAMGALKLALKLGCTEADAREIRNRWYRTFVRVRAFTQTAARVAEQRGYVKTILGRRARISDMRFSYKAANRIVQGGCADILKWKLVQINRWIERNNLDDVCKMLLTIHDSVVFEIHESRLDLVDTVKELLERVQCQPFNLKVPFSAEYKKIGGDWCEATYG